MKLTLILCMLLAAFAGHANADGAWTTEQKSIAVIGLIATVADYGQTRYIASKPYLHEYSPLMGRHPSSGRIAANFIVVPLAAYFIADSMTSEHRTAFLYAVSGIELGMVGRNAYLGYGVKF